MIKNNDHDAQIRHIKKMYPVFHVLALNLKKNFNPKTALDIGCAQGILVRAFRELGVKSYGVDCDDVMLKYSPNDIKQYLHKTDVAKEDLPFEQNSFDLVSATEVLEHLRDHKHLLREIKRVLRPGGIIYVTTPAPANVPNRDHINLHSRDFWIKEFESFGFVYDGKLVKNIPFPPDTKYGKIVSKFGKIGGFLLRLSRKFLYHVGIGTTNFVFVKKRIQDTTKSKV